MDLRPRVTQSVVMVPWANSCAVHACTASEDDFGAIVLGVSHSMIQYFVNGTESISVFPILLAMHGIMCLAE